ncbi:uncharacterized protein LOC115213307 [Octopus sinensis]|uniref:Uncharacterized protein LOC115213307 n=1 Tax=Octopus sinensis TaxID=2607531 RepID=A0A6P7SIP9_9MOLL|nr:uncharacterized protein LOC115213307 [Octopus sinensis]
MKEVYGDDAPPYDVVKHWHHQFKYGRTSVDSAPIPGRPHSAINDDTIHKAESTSLEDHRITIGHLAQEMKICVGSVEKNHLRTFTHAEVVYTIDSPDAHIFSEARTSQLLPGSFGKKRRRTLCQEKEENFFDRLITQEEIWVHLYDPDAKVQSKQWRHNNSPLPKKAHVQSSAGKVMLTVFWDQHRVVMIDILAKGTIINGAYHASLLQELWDAIKS